MQSDDESASGGRRPEDQRVNVVREDDAVFIAARGEDEDQDRVLLVNADDAADARDQLNAVLEIDGEMTPQEEWEAHNESFSYDPPEKPGDSWSSEEYQELYDRVINRRTQWFCQKCSGKGPMGSLQKARRHVEAQHAQELIEQYETPRDEMDTATDGGQPESSKGRGEDSHGLDEFSGGAD